MQAYRSTAPSKSDYFFRQFGWADLLASLPVKQLKIFRIFRLLPRLSSDARVWFQEHRTQPGEGPGRERPGDLAADGILVLEFGSLQNSLSRTKDHRMRCGTDEAQTWLALLERLMAQQQTAIAGIEHIRLFFDEKKMR